jgi:hypothetical protein
MENEILLSEELISNKIYFIRNQKVMLDRDLAILYGIETRVLKQAVKRNISRFPEDFMFELTELEYDSLRSQFVTLKKGRGQHQKYLPSIFTEHGVLMLSSVLKSDKAIQPEAKPNGAKLNEYSNYADIFKSETNAFGHHRFENRHSSNSEKIRKSRDCFVPRNDKSESYLDELSEKKDNDPSLQGELAKQKPRTKIGYKK